MRYRAAVRRVTGTSSHHLVHFERGKLVKDSELPVACSVEITPGNAGFHLLYLDAIGDYITDGWYATLEGAKAQASSEFSILETDWIETTD